jgi:hypothetical protein
MANRRERVSKQKGLGDQKEPLERAAPAALIGKRLASVRQVRCRLETEEAKLQRAVQAYIKEFGVRLTAARLGFSAAYVSDIAHGNRRVNDLLAEKLMGL